MRPGFGAPQATSATRQNCPGDLFPVATRGLNSAQLIKFTAFLFRPFDANEQMQARVELDVNAR